MLRRSASSSGEVQSNHAAMAAVHLVVWHRYGYRQTDWKVVVAATEVQGGMRAPKSARASDLQDVLHESSSLSAPGTHPQFSASQPR